MTRREQREVPIERAGVGAPTMAKTRADAVLDALASGPKTSSEVASIVGIKQSYACVVLTDLRGAGRVASEQIQKGHRAHMWSLVRA